MKKFLLIFLAALLLCSCAEKPKPAEPPESPDSAKSALVSGEIFEDTLPEPEGEDEVEKLERVLSEAGLEVYTREENIEDYSFEGFEHSPESCYVVEIGGGEPVFLRLYDSPETALDESQNYGPDGSEYGFEAGGMIIDYAAPIHFWLSGSAIIEYGSFDGKVAKILSEAYGEQFAGNEISQSGEVSFTYSQVEASAGEADLSAAEYIGTRERLEEYYSALKNSRFWSPYNEPQLSKFGEKLADYPEDWFNNHALIIVHAISPSSPADFKVDSVTRGEAGYKVEISLEAGMDASLVEKLILIELDGAGVDEEIKVEAAGDGISTFAYSFGEAAPRLDIETLKEILERDYTLSDFDGFDFDERSGETFCRRYFLEDSGFLLMIYSDDPDGGGISKMTLLRTYPDGEESCEIGKDDLEEFLKEQGYGE